MGIFTALSASVKSLRRPLSPVDSVGYLCCAGCGHAITDDQEPVQREGYWYHAGHEA